MSVSAKDSNTLYTERIFAEGQMLGREHVWNGIDISHFSLLNAATVKYFEHFNLNI